MSAHPPSAPASLPEPAAAPAPAPALPLHAATKYYRRLAKFGLGFALFGGLLVSGGVVAIGPVFGLMGAAYVGVGALFILLGRRRERTASGFVLVLQAGAALEEGRLDEAAALLDRVPRGVHRHVRRAALGLRAQIALLRGDLAAGERAVDEALALAPGLFEGTMHVVQAPLLHAGRAVIRAAKGDAEAAEEDILAVTENPEVHFQARARVEVARAILLDRADDRDALRDHLEKHRELLRRGTDPSERALVRAWARMLEAPRQIAYREQAKALESEAPGTGAFVRALSPGAAAFLGDAAAPSQGDPQPREDGALPANGGDAGLARPIGNSSVLRLVPLAALVLGAGAVLFATGSGRGGSRSPAGPGFDAAEIAFVAVASTIAFVVWRAQRVRRATRLTLSASRAYGEGRFEDATRLAKEVARSRVAYLAASAELTLAAIALEEADPVRALGHTRRGLDQLGFESLRAVASDTVYAPLVTTHAYALAALDRPEDAAAALKSLPQNPFERRQRFVVEMMIAVRARDRERIRALVGTAPRGLGALDALLVDVARAVVTDAGTSLPEVRRLRREVARPREKAFLQRFAPALLDGFEEIASPRVGDEAPARADAEIEAHAGAAETLAEAEAEAETLAEAEAEAEAEAGAEPRRARPGTGRPTTLTP